MLHEHAAALSAASPANRSRRLIKCAKDCGRYQRRSFPGRPPAEQACPVSDRTPLCAAGCPRAQTPLFRLLDLQAAILLTPPIVRHLAHVDLADRVRQGLTLRRQNINCRSFATISSGL
jgi:hypothetical protein